MVIYQSKERTRRFYTFVAFLAVVGIVGGVVLSKIIFGGVSAVDLQTRLIAACQNGRAPLQTYFQTQLVESERQSIKQLQAAFPDFPPEQIARSIHHQRSNLRTLLATYDPSKCDDQYR